jgi:Na+/H+ antiporter NhaD/arsenite permease-like protein
MHEVLAPNPWMIAPFAALLILIALGPLLFAKWWHHHYPKVAIGLALVTLGYYLFSLHATHRVMEVAHEYISFIALVGSLFVVAGGIHINVKGESTPGENVLFLFIGAVIANLIGTTGASMLLIRPWIRMNKYRITGFHIVFFIFLVSNLGGCLTPIGDPPLFIGFLKGVPFWWVAEHCWPMWAVAVGTVLAIFAALDYRNYQRAPKSVRSHLAEPPDSWRFEGGVNVIFLLVILASVFINKPMFLREGIMLAAAVASYFLTKKQIHAENHFTFEPVREVAILFIGIFSTMLPALDWLSANAKSFAIASPAFFYWSTGSLSALLDNAPTYYAFLIAAAAVFIAPESLAQLQQLILANGADLATHTEAVRNAYQFLKTSHPGLLTGGALEADHLKVAFMLSDHSLARSVIAISVSAVFFGAMTYIGNGPNFMVKSIADQNKAHAPTFLAYIFKYALPFLAPVCVLIWFLFFR